MRVCLFEDRGVADLEPLTLTRPVFQLFCGQTSLGDKQCRVFAPCEVGVLVRPYLAERCRLEQPGTPVNDLAWLRTGATVVVNGRWLPPVEGTVNLAGPSVALIGDDVAYAVVDGERLAHCTVETFADCLDTWKEELPRVPAQGRLVRYLWELVHLNGELIGQDFRCCPPWYPPGRRPAGLALVGPAHRLSVSPTASLDPMTVADTTRGPVVIDHHATVTAFSRLEGPCYLGPHSQVLGAKVRAGTTIGPHCRVGGEVEASILHGYTNKYHDGFLGHSYVGEWVNLGAGTHNSDLRNDYGEVTVTVNGRPVNTGLTKVGCFLGDHVKTGLGTLLNTGTSVGVFANLLPSGRLLPKYVPSFCGWWNGVVVENAELASLFHTAEEVMRRRDRSFTETHAALFSHLCDETAGERRRVLHDAELRRLRRSA